MSIKAISFFKKQSMHGRIVFFLMLENNWQTDLPFAFLQDFWLWVELFGVVVFHAFFFLRCKWKGFHFFQIASFYSNC
jgi:hypothetical protein